MLKAKLPYDEYLFDLAEFSCDVKWIINCLGDPHYIERDPEKTFGTEQWFWAFDLKSGQFILFDFTPSQVVGAIACNENVFPSDFLDIFPCKKIFNHPSPKRYLP